MISAETPWKEKSQIFNEDFHLPLYLPLWLLHIPATESWTAPKNVWAGSITEYLEKNSLFHMSKFSREDKVARILSMITNRRTVLTKENKILFQSLNIM
jgi:hypothetical protein